MLILYDFQAGFAQRRPSIFQILFYALRPTIIRAQRFTSWHLVNVLVQIAFNYVLVTNLGWYSYLYLIMSSFFAGSLHPCAGHFIAEHYLWDGLEQETYSYYGPLNILTYNVGYHNEHHDFPSVPWTRLPQLRAMAPEFYDTIPSHASWPMVIYNFIRQVQSSCLCMVGAGAYLHYLDRDSEVGPFARAKRMAKESVGGVGGAKSQKTVPAQ